MSPIITKKRTRSLERPWASVGRFQSHLRPRHREVPAPCSAGCPMSLDLRGALGLVAQRDKLGLTYEEALDRAWHHLTATNPFPAITGRICPHPCEDRCNRREKDAAVALSACERFIGDWGLQRGLELTGLTPPGPESRRIAIIGAGPCGLSCAYHLARRGHTPTVFESQPEAGGMLRYGVPPYRLSREVLGAEIARLRQVGVDIRCGERIGDRQPLEALLQTFDAVFVSIGAHVGRPLHVPGSDGQGVLPGVEFLRKANTLSEVTLGSQVVVVGDGQTALDAALLANRMGRARKSPMARVSLVRAHSRAEEDLGELEREGIEVLYEATPCAVLRDEAGQVTGLMVRPAHLGEPDPRGMRLPVPLDGASRSLHADMVIAAVSQVPDLDGLGASLGTSSWLEVDASGRSPVERVWAGGDSVTLGFAAQAIGQGLAVAESIDRSLRGESPEEPRRRQPISTGRVKLGLFDPLPRSTPHILSVEERLHNQDAEIDQGITRQQMVYEAGRCLSCGMCSGCERCWMYCTPSCFTREPRPEPGRGYFSISPEKCDGCRKCADECPTGFLEMA